MRRGRLSRQLLAPLAWCKTSKRGPCLGHKALVHAKEVVGVVCAKLCKAHDVRRRDRGDLYSAHSGGQADFACTRTMPGTS
jgi:hypothetical protein